MPTWDEITPDTERATRRSWRTLTNGIILVQLVTFLAALLAGAFKWPALSAALTFTSGSAIHHLQVWQFLTWPFAHSMELGPVLLFALSNYLLFLAGNELEKSWGARRLLVYFLGVTVYGAICHAAYQAVAADHAVPLRDAVGPALAVSLAQMLRTPQRTVLFLLIVPMREAAAFWCMFAVFLLLGVGFLEQGASPFAMVGAVAGGYLFCRFEPILDRYLDWRVSRAERSRHLEEFDVRRRTDEILEKIQRDGMASLSAQERRILKRASRIYRNLDE